MKTILTLTLLGIVVGAGMADAESIETLGPKCQKLAHEYSEDPAALNEMRLKQLQFCITQTLEQRYKTDPPELLKGTIIDPPPSTDDPAPIIPAPSQMPRSQK